MKVKQQKNNIVTRNHIVLLCILHKNGSVKGNWWENLENHTVHLVPPLASATTSHLHLYFGQSSLRSSVVVNTFIPHRVCMWCHLKEKGLWKEKAWRDKCEKDGAHSQSTGSNLASAKERRVTLIGRRMRSHDIAFLAASLDLFVHVILFVADLQWTIGFLVFQLAFHFPASCYCCA
jgi:hypothetical protein